MIIVQELLICTVYYMSVLPQPAPALIKLHKRDQEVSREACSKTEDKGRGINKNHGSLSAIYFIYYKASLKSQLSDISGVQINPLGSRLRNKDMDGLIHIFLKLYSREKLN